MRISMNDRILMVYSQNYRHKVLECSMSWGLAAQVSVSPSRKLWIHLHLLFINLFIRIRAFQREPAEENRYDEDKDYGFSYHGKGLWFKWGHKRPPNQGDATHKQGRYWVLWMPWGYKSAFKQDYFNWEGKFMFTLQPCHLPHKLYDAEKVLRKVLSRTFPYKYTLLSGVVQERTATIYATMMYWRMRGFPFIVMKRKSIEIEFNDEVGERSGSWKGGCMACGYAMKKGETPEETLKRMERERKF